MGKDDFLDLESPLVVKDDPSIPNVSFYIDDIISGVSNFQDVYNFMAIELFPRLDWARLKLSFENLELFMNKNVAFGSLLTKGGIICITPE